MEWLLIDNHYVLFKYSAKSFDWYISGVWAKVCFLPYCLNYFNKSTFKLNEFTPLVAENDRDLLFNHSLEELFMPSFPLGVLGQLLLWEPLLILHFLCLIFHPFLNNNMSASWTTWVTFEGEIYFNREITKLLRLRVMVMHWVLALSCVIAGITCFLWCPSHVHNFSMMFRITYFISSAWKDAACLYVCIQSLLQPDQWLKSHIQDFFLVMGFQSLTLRRILVRYWAGLWNNTKDLSQCFVLICFPNCLSCLNP